MHALRHFYASVLLDAGESVKALAECGRKKMAQSGWTVDIGLRPAPFPLISTGGTSLCIWSGVPLKVAIPAAALVLLEVKIRRSRRHTRT